MEPRIGITNDLFITSKDQAAQCVPGSHGHAWQGWAMRCGVVHRIRVAISRLLARMGDAVSFEVSGLVGAQHEQESHLS